MFSKSELKNGLLGCFEFSLFMREGVGRFDDTKSSALRSFFWPVAFLPVALVTMIMLTDPQQAMSFIMLHTTRIIITVALSFAVVFAFCKHYERESHFFRFVTISNWFNIPMMLLIFPIVILIAIGHGTPESFASYAIFITLLGYVYSAYILTRVLEIPWQMGGFVAIVGMAIDDMGWNVAAYIEQSFQVI